MKASKAPAKKTDTKKSIEKKTNTIVKSFQKALEVETDPRELDEWNAKAKCLPPLTQEVLDMFCTKDSSMLRDIFGYWKKDVDGFPRLYIDFQRKPGVDTPKEQWIEIGREYLEYFFKDFEKTWENYIECINNPQIIPFINKIPSLDSKFIERKLSRKKAAQEKQQQQERIESIKREEEERPKDPAELKRDIIRNNFLTTWLVPEDIKASSKERSQSFNVGPNDSILISSELIVNPLELKTIKKLIMEGEIKICRDFPLSYFDKKKEKEVESIENDDANGIPDSMNIDDSVANNSEHKNNQTVEIQVDSIPVEDVPVNEVHIEERRDEKEKEKEKETKTKPKAKEQKPKEKKAPQPKEQTDNATQKKKGRPKKQKTEDNNDSTENIRKDTIPLSTLPIVQADHSIEFEDTSRMIIPNMSAIMLFFEKINPDHSLNPSDKLADFIKKENSNPRYLRKLKEEGIDQMITAIVLLFELSTFSVLSDEFSISHRSLKPKSHLLMSYFKYDSTIAVRDPKNMISINYHINWQFVRTFFEIFKKKTLNESKDMIAQLQNCVGDIDIGDWVEKNKDVIKSLWVVTFQVKESF